MVMHNINQNWPIEVISHFNNDVQCLVVHCSDAHYLSMRVFSYVRVSKIHASLQGMMSWVLRGAFYVFYLIIYLFILW